MLLVTKAATRLCSPPVPYVTLTRWADVLP
jgi:hypothetical protein